MLQPAIGPVCWPLRITIGDLPPSPNRRMSWQARWRMVKPLAESVAWQARTSGLPRPLERAHVERRGGTQPHPGHGDHRAPQRDAGQGPWLKRR
jgi:hypothetical protein